MTAERWGHYRRSPPTQVGAGTLFHLEKMARAGGGKPAGAPGGRAPAIPAEGEGGKVPAPVIRAKPYVWRDPASFEPRQWVYGRHYIRKFISATVAPGGLGKSSLAIVEALEMATGKGLLTGKPNPERYRVWYFNGEDPEEEIEKRVAAACKHYGISESDVDGYLFIGSGRDTPIKLATESRDGLTIVRPVADALVAELRDRRIDVLILDPFVSMHGVSENDNARIDAVVSEFAAIADRANVSVELVHHVRKGLPGQDYSIEDARGAGALVAKTRCARVLNVMQAEEAATLGIPAEKRKTYVRVDDGKSNLAPPSETATWRHLASVDMGNHRPGKSADNIGVVEPWVKPEADEGITPEHVAELHARLGDDAPSMRHVQSPNWAGHTLAAVLGVDGSAPAGRKRLKQLLERWLAEGVLVVELRRNHKGETKEHLAPGPRAFLSFPQRPPQSPQSAHPDHGRTTEDHGTTGAEAAPAVPQSVHLDHRGTTAAAPAAVPVTPDTARESAPEAAECSAPVVPVVGLRVDYGTTEATQPPTPRSSIAGVWGSAGEEGTKPGIALKGMRLVMQPGGQAPPAAPGGHRPGKAPPPAAAAAEMPTPRPLPGLPGGAPLPPPPPGCCPELWELVQ